MKKNIFSVIFGSVVSILLLAISTFIFNTLNLTIQTQGSQFKLMQGLEKNVWLLEVILIPCVIFVSSFFSAKIAENFKILLATISIVPLSFIFLLLNSFDIRSYFYVLGYLIISVFAGILSSLSFRKIG
jgi:hypothetical protein